ncbi:hypothetical protein EON81_01355 [bacterium]|nr:MAG: hypothetical protein EON81_01355 [bacterium]
MILTAAAVCTLTVILASSRKGPEGWMRLLYAPPAALLILGVFWEQIKKIRMLLAAGAGKGYLVGEKGFGEVFLTEVSCLPIPEGWTSWSQFGRLEEGDNSFVVLRNWKRIVVPESMVDALKAASGEHVEPLPA